MHEASIALSLLDLAERNCRTNGYSRINRIAIQIGRLSGVSLEALQFAFDAIKRDTMANDASLVIEDVSATGYCYNCRDEFNFDSVIFSCPACGGPFEIRQGKELNLIDLEVD